MVIHLERLAKFGALRIDACTQETQQHTSNNKLKAQLTSNKMKNELRASTKTLRYATLMLPSRKISFMPLISKLIHLNSPQQSKNLTLLKLHIRVIIFLEQLPPYG